MNRARLGKQRQPRAQTDDQHDSRQNERWPQHVVESSQDKIGKQRLMGELVSERHRYAGIVGQCVGFDVHIDHHAAGVRLAGRRIDERHRHGFVGGKFCMPTNSARTSKPKRKPKRKSEIPMDCAAQCRIRYFQSAASLLDLRLNCRIVQESSATDRQR